MKAAWWIWGLAVVTTLVFAAPAGAEEEKQVKMLMLGDSVTKRGMPEAVQGPLNELTRGQARWTLVNAGVDGETAEGGKARLAKLLDAEKPDVVTIGYGLNDTGQKHSPDRFRGNMLAILDLIQKHTPAAKIILLTTTPLDESRHFLGKDKSFVDQGGIDLLLELKYNSITRRMAAEKNLSLIDLHRQFMADKGWTKYLLPDGAHLTKEGYAFSGKYLAETLAAWYAAGARNGSKAAETRDKMADRLKKVAAAAGEAKNAEARRKVLADLDEIWRACPYLPGQAVVWQAVYYYGKSADAAKEPQPVTAQSAVQPELKGK